ncbi:hypothetical protein O181_061348 [Austropuccinia psidii MF-1]|uniref:Uncharacterized protein n=1 Tax=Austropuccinia psidii MF-1 TaxID=1389203 RepID=A0A9Q3HYF7_9BASI|nr:hypothetical protein [Austropuccinia psidii MF-1]
MAKDFFEAIKMHFCPGSRFQKLKVVRDLLHMLVENASSNQQSNTSIILSLCQTFAMLKKLGIEADELRGLLAQASCHAPTSLDQVAFNQLITTAILPKGDDKPFSTFVGQVILNSSQRMHDQV